MKSKIFARVLCIILCVAIIGSILLIAIPLFSADAAETIVSGGSGYVTEDYVNLRSAASQSSSIVAVLRKNTRILFEEGALFNGSWLKIRELAGNRSGYVMRDYVAAGEARTIGLGSMTASTYVGCQYAFSQTGATAPVWSTSDATIATIDQNGVMTAKKAGTVSVKASQDGSSDSCLVKITEGVSTGVSPSALTLSVGGTGKLTANGQVYWVTSDSGVATVTGGVVRALHPGYATITAYNANGASTCLVHVTASPQPVPTLRLSAEKASTFTGCQYALGLTGGAAPVWRSSDTSVLTVDGYGVVTAKKAGTATVTVSENGATAQCRFTISDGTSTGIAPQDMNLFTDTTGKLTAKTAGVSWFSSNKAVATVSDGTVKALSAGYTTISAYTVNGASTCLVHVTDSALTSGIRLCSKHVTTYTGCQYAFWATGADNITWSTSDTSVAMIGDSGVMMARGAGSCTLTARSGSQVSTSKITVLDGTSTNISSTGMTLALGQSATLTAAAGVSWFSSNTHVATVSGGTVTAKGVGYTTISAYNANGASTCLVKVTEEQDEQPLPNIRGKVTVSQPNMRSGAGTGYSIVATLTKDTLFYLLSETLYNTDWYHAQLENGTKGYVHRAYFSLVVPPTVKLSTTSFSTYAGCQYALTQTGAEEPVWSSSDTSVATVDQNGVVTAKKAGSATISASENGGAGSCTVTVKSGTSTHIAPTSLELTVGSTGRLTADSGVNWFSSNKAAATVSGGTVTAVGEGYTTISAYTSSGASTCLVHVTAAAPTPTPGGTIRFGVSAVTTYTGVRYALPVTGAAGASWSSSNTGVATVDQNGVVTAKAAGTTVIRAANFASSASCTVTVRSGYGPGISLTEDTIAAGKSLLLSSDSYSADWSSSNTAIAVVEDGVVTTKASGYVTIIASTSNGASACLLHVTEPDSIRFVYTSPNSAPRNATVSFKAITDRTRTAVQFVVTNGTSSYTVNATSKVSDGDNYIWTGSRALSTAGLWKVQAYAKTASTGYATTPENGEGEVFVSNASDYAVTVTGERRASNEVLDMIASFEGFLPDLTGDYITGDPTIGHGKVIWENEQFYNHLTKAEAFAYLCQTTNAGPYTSVTNDYLLSHNAKFNQYQFDALVCFAYNLGPYALVNDEQFSSAMFGSSSGGTVRAGGSGYINASDIDLRSGAGTSYAIISAMAYNTSFTFVDATLHNGSWYHIRLANGTTGYVYHTYATPLGSSGDLADTNRSAFTQRMLQYHHAAGSCYYGLLWRRVDEVETYFYGDYTVDGDRNKYGMYFRCANNSSFGIG